MSCRRAVRRLTRSLVAATAVAALAGGAATARAEAHGTKTPGAKAPATANRQELPAAAPAAATRPQTLRELMRVMAETPGVVADFTETKHLALLEAPLVTEGKLYFIPPDRMARYTTSPGESVLIIDGDRLLFDDAAGGDDIDLGTNPLARVFVDNFIVLFNGDLEELQRLYDPEFSIDGDQWSLRLEPRSAPLSRLVESIVMRGDAAGMRSMVLRETGGDTTETVFDDLDARHRFSAGETAEIFRAEPPAPVDGDDHAAEAGNTEPGAP